MYIKVFFFGNKLSTEKLLKAINNYLSLLIVINTIKQIFEIKLISKKNNL